MQKLNIQTSHTHTLDVKYIFMKDQSSVSTSKNHPFADLDIQTFSSSDSHLNMDSFNFSHLQKPPSKQPRKTPSYSHTVRSSAAAWRYSSKPRSWLDLKIFTPWKNFGRSHEFRFYVKRWEHISLGGLEGNSFFKLDSVTTAVDL